jgi:acyl carrier protein
MSARFLKGSRDKVADFKKGRERQSDEDFLRDLGMLDSAEEREVALAVRRAVANVGLIDPLYIRADDREREELSVLPLWDSMDWVALLMELEDELSLAIPDKAAEKIKVSNFSVRSCVRDTIMVVRELRGTG